MEVLISFEFSDFTKMIFSNCKTDHPPTSFCILFYSVFRRVIIQIYDLFQKFNYQSYTDCCFYLFFFLMLSRFYIAAQSVRMIYLKRLTISLIDTVVSIFPFNCCRRVFTSPLSQYGLN